MSTMSWLQQKRLEYKPKIPRLLQDLNQVVFKELKKKKKCLDSLRPFFPKTWDQKPFGLEEVKSTKSSPLTVGVLFSGGPASGGHNVIAALLDGLKTIHPKSRLLGFLGGVEGLLQGSYKELQEKEVGFFRNQGGFDLLGTGRGKIETEEHLNKALKACQQQDLDGLVVIGGDDSNTNAAILAEYFLEKGCQTKVVGIPKTIDGDLRSEDIEISFGFDTACKTYSEIIGNIARDALSAQKYYHFIKLMGRSASHICLECALNVQPNLALIAEEKKSLEEIVKEIADLICLRFEKGKEYGVILIPEGLIEFIPEMQSLISQLNQLIQEGSSSFEKIVERLQDPHRNLFLTLPEKIQKQLLFDRDPHGNMKLAQIDTDELLIERVTQELKRRTSYKGKFSPQRHFLGYEGRACFPSNFDANYCYSLGLLASLAIRDGLTGVICSFQNLSSQSEEWRAKAVPIIELMRLEVRKGKEKPVIEKSLVDINGVCFVKYRHLKKLWAVEDHYRYPGPLQFFGDSSLIDSCPVILNK